MNLEWKRHSTLPSRKVTGQPALDLNLKMQFQVPSSTSQNDITNFPRELIMSRSSFI